MTVAFRTLVATALALATLSCSKDKPPAPPSAPASGPAPAAVVRLPPPLKAGRAKPNLVLVTLEATRADHLGCYGDTRAETPGIDQLAREGAILTQAIAVAPLTLPSHVSILTALYPPAHGVRDDTGFKLLDAATTLTEHLKAQGYATAASIGARVLAGDAGLKQGFDSYAEPTRFSRAGQFVVTDAIEAINRIKAKPFFLWVQLDDPRTPYFPPPDYRARFGKRLYDGDISYADAQFKRLFDHLRASGVLDDTVVVVTADHAESLGEHDEETHGLFLYDSTLKVPMIVRYPSRIAAGTKFDGLLSGVDLAPTLLELMGLPALPAAQGESRAARLLGGSGPEREVIYAESMFGARTYGWTPLYALRSSEEKYISGPVPELYNLRRDPFETINVASQEAKAVDESWRPSLDEALRVIGGAQIEASPAQAAKAAHRNLAGLVMAHNLYMRARTTIEEGRPASAAPFLQQALAKDPGNPAVTTLLAALRAEPVAQSGGVPSTFASEYNRGNALFVKGNLDESAKAFRAALAFNPGSPETHYALGNVLAAQGDAAGAEAELRAAVAADPKMAIGWNKLGIVLDKANRRSDAIAAFSRALEASPDDPDPRFNRAKLELMDQNLTEARRDLDRLLKAHPDYAVGRFLEAHLCVAEKNNDGAKEALTKFLALPKVDPKMKAAATDMLQKLGG
jgi:arylsulfatase A-like enzyme/thioredoxin-like negative regulator of GroEL